MAAANGKPELGQSGGCEFARLAASLVRAYVSSARACVAKTWLAARLREVGYVRGRCVAAFPRRRVSRRCQEDAMQHGARCEWRGRTQQHKLPPRNSRAIFLNRRDSGRCGVSRMRSLAASQAACAPLPRATRQTANEPRSDLRTGVRAKPMHRTRVRPSAIAHACRFRRRDSARRYCAYAWTTRQPREHTPAHCPNKHTP